MTTLRQAAQAVVERWDKAAGIDSMTQRMKDLRAALDAPGQEPVGYVWKRDFIGSVIARKSDWAPHETPVYAAPFGLEALTKERDALKAAAKLALEALDDWYYGANQDRPKAAVYVALQALKQAGVTA